MTYRNRLVLFLPSLMLACADDAALNEDSSSDDGTDTGSMMVTTLTTAATTPTTNADSDSTGDEASTGTPDDTAEGTTMAVDSSTGEDSGTTDEDSGSTGSTGETGTMGSSESTGGPGCGNGVIEDEEDCDDDALGGATCESLGMGFTRGTLSCSATCEFDVSGCTTCGNAMVEGSEECDADDLDDATCESLGMGFAGGTLACDAGCMFDVSGCTTCGNGVINGAEACDGVDLGGNDCIDLGMGFTAGTLACQTDCSFDTSECSSVPWPDVGELVITEIMQNPLVLADADGEYFEVYNPTLVEYQLGNCFIDGNGVDAGFIIDADLPVPALSYVVIATDSDVDQGFVADYQWLDADFGLNNASDTVRIECDGVTVDQVAYDNGATFPDPNGASMNLDSGSLDAVANDLGSNWCESFTSYNGDFGTPGTANVSCTPATYTIDFCRLQFPTLIVDSVGTDVDVFGRVFIDGLTNLSGVNDPAAEVIGYVGYGPDGSDPAVDATWTWVAGVPNAAYGPASPSYEANNDEYTAVLTVPAPAGEYDFAFRFTGDAGATFSYCDGQPEGSSNGYDPADAGQMTAIAVPAPALYFSEYAEGSGNNKALEIYNASGAVVDLVGCVVRQYFNGNVVAGNTTALSGSLAVGDVFVVCDDGIEVVDPPFSPSSCDILATGNFFNGDDAVELACLGTTLDVIGQIGVNPGVEWLMNGVGTADETLRRSCSVTQGDADGSDVFDPSAEWETFPIDTFADFGQYICL